MNYCTICNKEVESFISDTDYYFRCTDKKCKGRKGVAVTREKVEKDVKNES
jgi:hypothetical protein